MIIKYNLTKIGKIIKSHGIAGELLCDFLLIPDCNNIPKYLIIEDDGIMVPFFVTSFRKKTKNSVIVMFQGIESESMAKSLYGKEIFSDIKIKPKNINKDISSSLLIGFKIVDKKYGDLGKIIEINKKTINTLFVLENILIPAQKCFILNMDYRKKIIYTSLPDGICDV